MSLIAPANSIYHLYNQGNQKRQIFFECLDYFHFLELFRQHVHPFCDVFAWCLMPNHYHFMILLKPESELKVRVGALEMSVFSNGMRKLQSQYARYFNAKYVASGNVFRQKARLKCCDEIRGDYRITLFNYIHFNPVTSGLVTTCQDWPYSSFNDFFTERGGTLIQKNRAIELLGIEIDHTGF